MQYEISGKVEPFLLTIKQRMHLRNTINHACQIFQKTQSVELRCLLFGKHRHETV